MSCYVFATGLIKDPMPLVEKSRASCAGGRFPLSFIHQVIINNNNSLVIIIASAAATGAFFSEQTEVTINVI